MALEPWDCFECRPTCRRRCYRLRTMEPRKAAQGHRASTQEAKCCRMQAANVQLAAHDPSCLPTLSAALAGGSWCCHARQGILLLPAASTRAGHDRAAAHFSHTGLTAGVLPPSIYGVLQQGHTQAEPGVAIISVTELVHHQIHPPASASLHQQRQQHGQGQLLTPCSRGCSCDHEPSRTCGRWSARRA